MSNNISTIQILKSFLTIGLCSFGGGMSLIPLLEEESKKLNIDKDTFFESLIIAQSLPGPMIINVSISIGYTIKKEKGAIIALIGVVAPSLISIILIASLLNIVKDNIYVKKGIDGIVSAVPSLILIAFFSLLKKIEKSYRNIIIFIVSIFLLQLKINPGILILVAFIIEFIIWRYKND